MGLSAVNDKKYALVNAVGAVGTTVAGVAGVILVQGFGCWYLMGSTVSARSPN